MFLNTVHSDGFLAQVEKRANESVILLYKTLSLIPYQLFLLGDIKAIKNTSYPARAHCKDNNNKKREEKLRSTDATSNPGRLSHLLISATDFYSKTYKEK